MRPETEAELAGLIAGRDAPLWIRGGGTAGVVPDGVDVLETSGLAGISLYEPGALTLVVPRRADTSICPLVSAGLDTLALRVPSHEVAQQLITACDSPSGGGGWVIRPPPPSPAPPAPPPLPSAPPPAALAASPINRAAPPGRPM